MTSNEIRFQKQYARRPHPVKQFFARPYWTRRHFFRALGTGIAGSAIMGAPAFGQRIERQGAPTINRAKNVVMLLMTGAISQVDTFDFKETPGTPMGLLKPETINGIRWPAGLMPKLGGHLGEMAIVRSVKPWALQHSLSQAWVQIGRSPAGVLGDVAPNIGSIVALEKEAERKTGQVFPTFMALNANNAIGSGYMPVEWAPFKIVPAVAGLPDTTNPDGETRFAGKYGLLGSLDKKLRTENPYSAEMQGYDAFYEKGRQLMYNDAVNQAFRFTPEEAARYGASGFGNACLVAAKVLAANGGTRYVQINFGSWDHHQNIYDDTNLPRMTRILDDGLSQMLSDMKASGILNETLVVLMGEFGRTVGGLTGQSGRDHYAQQFAMFAGAGVRGGRAIGSTDSTGARTEETGWSRDRDIRPEDVETTIYSAMGIDYTTVRYDDPFGRGFYYVPESDQDLYGPINELWG
ncbi:MAG: DUF1501 domain-containing protein [Bryobacteraceae bacterium]